MVRTYTLTEFASQGRSLSFDSDGNLHVLRKGEPAVARAEEDLTPGQVILRHKKFMRARQAKPQQSQPKEINNVNEA